MPQQIDVREFQMWAEQSANAPAGERPLLLDVREPWEVATASIQMDGLDVQHIVMHEIPQRLAELPSDRPIVCVCHGGVRSMQVAAFLERQGFDRAINLAGGVDAWSVVVDPTVPRY
jgi:rhodanese-related sulfurtransferase